MSTPQTVEIIEAADLIEYDYLFVKGQPLRIDYCAPHLDGYVSVEAGGRRFEIPADQRIKAGY